MNRIPGILIAITISVNLMFGIVSAEEPTKRQRVSIAISGGASKGAYEAGLNWAALKLIREVEDLHTLNGGRIRTMELASVAGASAGGINSILSGLTWCSLPEAEGGLASRIDDNIFRDTWLRLDINALLPPQPDSGIYLPDDALLSRRDYFASAGDLVDQWGKPAYRSGCRVPLGVTVTRVEPMTLMVEDIEVQNQRFYIPFELRVQKDGRVAYYFDPSDYPGLYDDPAMILMPHPNHAPEFSIPDNSIIEVAAATSAFPAAFGRRRLQYCRLKVHTDVTQPESPSKKSSNNLVCPTGYELDEAVFADGGLFDNLPIGLARTLAEFNSRTLKSPLPVTYFYIDPNRLRYDTPDPPDNRACTSGKPPDACRIMDFSLFSESKMLVGAYGTARRYELYRETTSENWRHNLSQLSYHLAEIVSQEYEDLDCAKELPYFDKPITCAEAIRRAGRLLEIAYDRVKPEISPPYSPERLMEARIADNCAQSTVDTNSKSRVECRLDFRRYRNVMADALMSIIKRMKMADDRLYESIGRSRQSIHDDRSLRVSSRGAPITGTLLSAFGSFLDYKFRNYDYYVGVYDAIVMTTNGLCSLQYSPNQQAKEFRQCADQTGRQFYDAVGVGDDARGRYVFARIAAQEFTNNNVFKFSYSPLPAVDRDMQIIHDGLATALEAGGKSISGSKGFFATEDSFFAYLKAQNFTPTKPADGTEPLLAQIIDYPGTWETEMTRRISARLTYLEREAANLYTAREPKPELRDLSYTPLLGASAHLLQSATYKYPRITFSPSTAADDWIWRNIMPYELGFDILEGDIIATWQPTVAISSNSLLNLRASFGFAGGLFRSTSDERRENYFGLGFGYIHRTESATISSIGFTPTLYHSWDQPVIGEQDSFGGDIHVSFLKDRLRMGLGARDFSDFDNTWFLTFSILDLPGATYWLTR
jgi:predicted acylesterase/phospholipase RssA